MNINKYNIRFNEDRIGQLVREDTVGYDADSCIIDSPEKAAELLEYVFDASNLTQEHFWLITLDGARKCNGLHLVTVGTLMSSLVHPREVYQRAVLSGAASIIVAHNHPSGSREVSEHDREVTKRLRDAGKIMGIQFDDHIIICNGDWMSAA